MRKFIQKALERINRLDPAQIQMVIADLAKENERLETVLESMTDGLVVVDNEHRVALYNKSAERLLPFAHGEIYDRVVWTVVDDSDIAGFIQQNLERQETVVDKEFPLAMGGATRIIACSILPLVATGRIQGSLFHIEEVTEKRGKEARLRRAESLASLTTLAAGVAHEIKNPLGSIGIHIQLLQKALRDEANVKWDSVGHFLAVLTEEVGRLNKIVVDFLFAVRPMNVDLRERDLNPVLVELLDFVQFELREAGIRLETRLASGLPKLRIDEKYVKQAVLNIIKNAIAAMPNGGTLTVQTLIRGDEVKLIISDTGVGISAEVINKIFEPYFTTREFGNGIGLTIVYKIVKEHQGEITVDSREGRGARFTISLPVPQKEQHLLSWRGGES